MAWGDDSDSGGWGDGGDTGVGDSFGDAFGSGYGSDQGAYGSSDSYGGDYGAGGDTTDIGNSYDKLGWGSDVTGNTSDYGYSINDLVSTPSTSLYGNPSLANLESYYSTPTQIGYSSPFAQQSPIGYLGSLATQPTTEQQSIRQMMSTPADTTMLGWNDQLAQQQQLQNLSPVANWNPNQVSTQLRSAYESNPMTTAAQAAQTLGTYGSLVNPAAGLAGLAGGLTDYGLKSYYGQNPSAQGIAGTVGSTLGSSFAGPAGGVLGSSLARSAVSETPGQTFGSNFGQGVGSTLGGLLGGSIAGPIGARIGSMTLGDLAKVAMTAQAYRGQQQQARDIREAQGRQTQYANRLADLVNNPTSFQNTPMFQAQRAQALREGLRGLAAQGKLGSGARAYAMGNVASNIANQYYNQEANRLANLAGTGAQQAELARAAANAKGAQNYMLMQLASQYLS